PFPPPLDTPSLHDALPICPRLSQLDGLTFRPPRQRAKRVAATTRRCARSVLLRLREAPSPDLPRSAPQKSSAAALPLGKLPAPRSEEHTSELQSHLNLVCR